MAKDCPYMMQHGHQTHVAYDILSPFILSQSLVFSKLALAQERDVIKLCVYVKNC